MLSGYLAPTLTELSIVHNFTVESQVQYHAPLAFEPLVLPRTNDDSEPMAYGLDQDQLKTFINSAEWTLGTVIHLKPAILALLIPVHSFQC